MPDPTTAFLVGTSIYGTASARKSAKEASAASEEASEAALQFETQRYEDWQNTYGGIQENLREHYQGLSPEYYTATGLESHQAEFDKAMTRMDESLAQRGMSMSGISESLKSQALLNSAETKAAIRLEAPNKAAEAQKSFLQVGLGQNPANSMSNTLAGAAQTTAQTAQTTAALAGQATADTLTTIGTSLPEDLTKGTGLDTPGGTE